MKKYILPFLIVFLIFLSSCEANEKEYELKIDNLENFFEIVIDNEITKNGIKYTLNLNEKNTLDLEDFNISLEIHFKVYRINGDYIYRDTKITNLRTNTYSGFISNENVDYAETYYIYINNVSGKVYSTKNFENKEYKYTHLDKPIFLDDLVKDKEKNLENFNELNEKLNSYAFENQNYLQINLSTFTSTKIDGKTIYSDLQSQSTKANNHLKYIEMSIGNIRIIVKEEDNTLITYTYDINGLTYDDKYLVYPTYNNIPDILDVENPIEYEIDPNKMNVSKIGTGYLISAYIKDIIDEETYNGLIELYESLSLDTTIIDTTIVEVKYILTQTIEIETNITIKINGVETTVKNTQKISFDEFEIIDLNNKDIFEISPSIELNSNIPFSELDEFYKTSVNSMNYPHYYKFNLEKGQYDIKYTSYHKPYIKVYDSTFRVVDVNPFVESSHFHDEIKMTFIIPKDGIYYIEYMQHTSSYGYDFMLSKLEYETIFDKKNIPSISTGKVFLDFEGSKDIIGFSINVPNNSAIRLKTTDGFDYGDVSVLYEHKQYSTDMPMMVTQYISILESTFIAITKRPQYFYFFPNDFDSNLIYEIEIEVITSNSYLNSNYGYMQELTEEMTKTPIIIGSMQQASYLKFTVNEKSKFKFIIEDIVGYTTSVVVYKKSGELHGEFSTYGEHELEKGEYYIKFYYEYLLSIFNVSIEEIKK